MNNISSAALIDQLLQDGRRADVEALGTWEIAFVLWF